MTTREAAKTDGSHAFATPRELEQNREHAERLIAEGRTQPAGLTHVEAARAE